MTYKNLKKFLSNNINTETKFDLIPKGIKSKLIFVVGDMAKNTASFLSSIMNECKIEHSRYIFDESAEIKYRFIKSGVPVPMDDICQCAEYLIKKSNKSINSDELLLICALELLYGSEYLILEMSEELYRKIIRYVAPYALILAIDDDALTQEIIDHAPVGLEEIIALSKKDNFDYISTQKSSAGAKVTYASPNKRTIASSTVFGTDFFHYDYLYKTRALNLNNIPLAHLAIESATVLFSAARPLMRIGIYNASLTNDLELYSLSPAILLREGKDDFSLFHKMKFKTVYENDELSFPVEDTVFCGNRDFINKIKRTLK